MIDYENLGKLNAPFFDEYKTRFAEILERVNSDGADLCDVRKQRAR